MLLTNIWNLVLLITVIYDLSAADFFEECVNKDQTYAEIKEDCSRYIFCHGEESFSGSCPEDNPYFSIEEQTCDTDKKVCNDRTIINEVSIIEEVESSTLASSTVSASSSSDLPITIPTAITNNNLSTATTSTVASTTISSSQNSSVTTALPLPPVPSFCPAVDNPQKAIFLPHKKSCSEYFLCYQGERVPMRCSNMLHFDVRQQKCDYPENVKCHIMDVASPREQCLRYTFDLYPHPRNCNYYYQCTLGYLKVMQCPLNMGWHYEKRACVRRSHAKCYNSFARAI